MRCDNTIAFTGKLKKRVVVVKEGLRGILDNGQVKLRTEPELCGGEITCNVAAVDEPSWGGSYAELHVDWVCQRCGWTFFPELPGVIDISEFLTAYAARMSSTDRMAKRREWEEAEQRRQDVLLDALRDRFPPRQTEDIAEALKKMAVRVAEAKARERDREWDG